MNLNIKKIVFLSSLFLSVPTAAQINVVPEKKLQKGFGEIDFLSIGMPNNEVNMGITGIHYNIELSKWGAYGGLGIYGAVSGIRGGFFTLGVNLGVKKYFSDQVFTDIGFNLGGGGGAAAPDGGGAFILPHVNLGYNFKDFNAQAGWSYVDFFDGGYIAGSQFNFGVEVPLNFDYANYINQESEFIYNDIKPTKWNRKARRKSLIFNLSNFNLRGGDRQSYEQLYTGETIRLAGFELASYFHENWFAFVNLDGAYSAIQAGFMDVFMGVGYLYAFNQDRTNIIAKIMLGAGGGGGIETGGVFIFKPDISIEQKIYGDFFFALNKGKVMNPEISANNSIYGLGLKYYINHGGAFNGNTNFDNFIFKGINVIVKHDLYLDSVRNTNPPEDLYQISLQLNLNINKNLFVSGQSSFANFGSAGAYAEGLVGAGARTNPFFSNTHFFTQVLVGAAGGGGISTGEGFIVKPSIGISTKLYDKFSLRFAGGYVKATGSALSSKLFNFGIQYNISILKKTI